jgi:hypothetical protein
VSDVLALACYKEALEKVRKGNGMKVQMAPGMGKE